MARHLLLLPILLCGFTLNPGPPAHARVNDFIAYWTAARQVLDGKNPYDERSVLALERQVGFEQPKPLIMRNPPWTIPVIAVLGLLSFSTAQDLWLGINLIAVLLSARWLWGLYRVQGQSPWTAWLATGFFLPVAVVLAIGQIGPLVLLGIAGFLHFEKQKKFGWAGAFLFLVALKPHLVYLLWAALLLWSIRRRTARALVALASVTLAACAIAVALDHSIFVQYLDLLTRGGVLAELTPTVSGLLRLCLPRYHAIQALPALLALIWFGSYWRSARDRWQWREQIPILLLVSLLTTSYDWFFDQVVVLPCVFQAAAWLTTSQRFVSIAVAVFYLGTNAAVLALILEHQTTFWYVWTVPAWFALYLISRTQKVQLAVRGPTLSPVVKS
ncbi:MAG: glycosyltransferase family 87 protein [Candidatus Sulfotelmatobacter sp.]